MMATQARIVLRQTTRSSLKAMPFTALSTCAPLLFRVRFGQWRCTSSLFDPSDEQRAIASLSSTQNVLVSARPGSGKTATVEAIVSAHPDKRTATLLYSKQLQIETASRLRPYTNCSVFTFHSMAGHLFGGMVHNDAVLLRHRARVQATKKAPAWNHEPFDIIVLDEFQDCTDILFWLVGHFVAANNHKLRLGGRPPARLVVLGDELQCIYPFRGADQRYLSLAPDLLRTLTPYPFAAVPLSRSFRLSKQTVQFINDVFLGSKLQIVSEKDGPKPLFIRCPHDKDHARSELVARLARLVHQYGPENTAILAPSIRSKANPLQKLVNMLKQEYDFPMDVSLDEDAPLDDRVIKGKLCVSTIHQFKGRERDLVIVFDIDASYFNFFGRNLRRDQCPNTIFVALTRAVKQLVIVHKEPAKLMSFMPVDALYKTAEVVSIKSAQTVAPLSVAKERPASLGLSLPKTASVRGAIRHVPDAVLEVIVSRECLIKVLTPAFPIREHNILRSAVPAGPKAGMYETTNDINGMVITAAFEHQAADALVSLGCDSETLDQAPPQDSKEYISWLSRLACEYEASLSGYKPRPIQMKNHKFDWIRPNQLAVAVSRIQNAIGRRFTDLRFEYYLTNVITIDDKAVRLNGQADVVSFTSSAGDDGAGDALLGNASKFIDTVWEIKLVQALSNQHIVQVCAYAYLIAAKFGRVPRIILFNARDNQTLEVVPRDGIDGLERMLEDILRAKYTSTAEQDTSNLVKQCLDVTSEVARYSAI
ncbi:p-loop containing nucleoside triphosphate hydrolase protein [Ophiostoma piceae UAMH 11346]|uniref:p-loop containing nucleoside triphosphate hydrolase protein n=1 Tax=Ophiostoma piceae (strain UAMH 11346) TaxID=1262450 RepID=S3C5V6_OPHP1|nr:p-loop containing nucleoside triphosphate hydrolase protein [Ophiostoma piceae UAMH 11346]